MDRLNRELEALEMFEKRENREKVLHWFSKAVFQIPEGKKFKLSSKSVRQRLHLERKRKLSKREKRLLNRLRREAAA